MRRRASLLVHEKLELPDGFIIEVKVWNLPATSAERPHGLKYSLYFGRGGERIVAYDNETGKGDHRHYRQREEPYVFQTFERLLSDFWQDVRKELDVWMN